MFGSKDWQDDGAYAGIRNTNVKLAFLYRWTFSVTQGLWNLGIGSTYIYMMEGSSNTVCQPHGFCVQTQCWPCTCLSA